MFYFIHLVNFAGLLQLVSVIAAYIDILYCFMRCPSLGCIFKMLLITILFISFPSHLPIENKYHSVLFHCLLINFTGEFLTHCLGWGKSNCQSFSIWWLLLCTVLVVCHIYRLFCSVRIRSFHCIYKRSLDAVKCLANVFFLCKYSDLHW